MRTSAPIGTVLLGFSVLAACAYQPSSFGSSHRPFPGQHATIGCLDLGIDRRPDLPGGKAVLTYEFGNRCDQPALVDLASVWVYARNAQGQTVQMLAFDPQHEIRASRLDGRAVGREVIAYESSIAIHSICVDAASIAHAAPAHWLCFH